MSLRWIFLVLVVAWGINAFGAVEDFNLIIAQAEIDQNQLAYEIAEHIAATESETTLTTGQTTDQASDQSALEKEKTLENKTEKKSVSSEGFNSKLFR